RFALEIGIHGPLGEPCRGSHLVQRDPVKAAACEELRRRVEHAGASNRLLLRARKTPVGHRASTSLMYRRVFLYLVVYGSFNPPDLASGSGGVGGAGPSVASRGWAARVCGAGMGGRVGGMARGQAGRG